MKMSNSIIATNDRGNMHNAHVLTVFGSSKQGIGMEIYVFGGRLEVEIFFPFFRQLPFCC